MRFSKGDWTFTIIAILLLVFLSGWLYLDFTAGLEAGNEEAARWLRGGRGASPLPPESLFPRMPLGDRESPVWSRRLSDPPGAEPAADA